MDEVGEGVKAKNEKWLTRAIRACERFTST